LRGEPAMWLRLFCFCLLFVATLAQMKTRDYHTVGFEIEVGISGVNQEKWNYKDTLVDVNCAFDFALDGTKHIHFLLTGEEGLKLEIITDPVPFDHMGQLLITVNTVLKVWKDKTLDKILTTPPLEECTFTAGDKYVKNKHGTIKFDNVKNCQTNIDAPLAMFDTFDIYGQKLAQPELFTQNFAFVRGGVAPDAVWTDFVRIVDDAIANHAVPDAQKPYVNAFGWRYSEYRRQRAKADAKYTAVEVDKYLGLDDQYTRGNLPEDRFDEYEALDLTIGMLVNRKSMHPNMVKIDQDDPDITDATRAAVAEIGTNGNANWIASGNPIKVFEISGDRGFVMECREDAVEVNADALAVVQAADPKGPAEAFEKTYTKSIKKLWGLEEVCAAPNTAALTPVPKKGFWSCFGLVEVRTQMPTFRGEMPKLRGD